MVEAGTEFSLRAGAMRTWILLTSGAMVAFSLAMLFMFQYMLGRFDSSPDLAGMWIVAILLFAISAALPQLIYPFRYVVTESGVRIDHFLCTRSVDFKDIESVVIGHVLNDPKLAERLVLTSKRSKMHFLGVIRNFDQLRDHIIESVDPKIVKDRREPARN